MRPSATERIGAWLQPLVVVVFIAWASSSDAAVVYSALQGGRWDVYFQNELSSKPQRLSLDVDGDAGSPSLDARGTQAAFETISGRILVCPLARQAKCNVVEEPGAQLARSAWLRNEKQLLLVRFKSTGTAEDSDLFQTTAGKLVPFLTQTGVQDDPDVSADGKWLAYSSAQTVALRRAGVQIVQHIWLADLTTGHAAPLVPADARDTEPRWAPSGDVIAFASNRTGQFEIWGVRRDGSDLKQITSGAGSKTSPVWSPDAKSIMFTMIMDGRYSLWIVNADGSNLHPFEPFGAKSDVQLRDADWR